MKSFQFLAASLALALSGSAFGAPTIDGPKAADPRLPWKETGGFSALHGEDGTTTRFSGFGSFDEARSILAQALRDGASDQDGGRLLEAARQAYGVCGDAAKYQTLVTALIKGGEASTIGYDTANAMRGGMDFLVNGGGGSVTQGLATLGLSMVRGELQSFDNANRILGAVVDCAAVEAAQENAQWATLLTFAREAVGQLRNWQSGYAALERAAFAVAHAEGTSSPFMGALAGMAQTIQDPDDACKVLVAGFNRFGRESTSRAHQVVCAWLVSCSGKLAPATTKDILATAAGQLEKLSPEAPAAKVLLQAGIDMSSGAHGTVDDQALIALEALATARTLDVPARVAAAIDGSTKVATGIRDAAERAQFVQGVLRGLLEGKFVYKVRRNDTLGAIAQAYGLTLSQVAKANPQIKDLNKIFVGQEINIPLS